MRVLGLFCLMVLAAADVDAQEVIVGAAAYHQSDAGDFVQFGHPWMTELRVTFPMPDARFSVEPFVDIRSTMAGILFRQRLARLTTPAGHHLFVTYGVATFLLPQAGVGWSQQVLPRLRLTSEVRLITFAAYPIGVLGMAGLAVRLR